MDDDISLLCPHLSGLAHSIGIALPVRPTYLARLFGRRVESAGSMDGLPNSSGWSSEDIRCVGKMRQAMKEEMGHYTVQSESSPLDG